MKLNWLNRSVLDGPYYVLCQRESEYHAAMAHLKVARAKRPNWLNPGAGATTHFLQGPHGMCAIVCLSSCKGKTIEQINALLVHEGVHIWQEYERSIGETNPGDEIEAYAIQGYAQSLMTAFQAGKSRKGRS